jgi:hypothetical protein
MSGNWVWDVCVRCHSLVVALSPCYYQNHYYSQKVYCMRTLWKYRQQIRLRMECVATALAYIVGILFGVGMAGVSFQIYQSRPTAEPEHLLLGAMGAGFVWIMGYLLVKLLQTGHVFYMFSERRDYSSLSFDAAQQLEIGPLPNLTGRTLILSLRWRPHKNDTPGRKSFHLYLKKPPEPEATFTAELLGLGQGEEVVIAQKSVLQKVDPMPVGQGEDRPVEYDTWREISLPVEAPFSQYKVRLSLAVHRPDKEEKAAEPLRPERLWMKMYAGMNLSDLKRREVYEYSNLAQADINIV